MTRKLTREENVQAVFDLKAGYTLGLADVEILKRVAHMALAAMDSEPVAWVMLEDLADKDIVSTPAYPDINDAMEMTHGELEPLYRHAQQPVVDIEPTQMFGIGSIFKPQVVSEQEADCDDCAHYNPKICHGEGCPAISQQSVQPAPVVPDIDELRLAFEAAERESGDGFNLHKYGIGYADDETQGRWDTWLACRAAMLQSRSSIQPAPELDFEPNTAEARSGNSPVIPGRWIPVSERMPEKNGTYQVWNGKHVGAVPFLFGSFQCLNPEQVTHWMPTAKPPREVK
ncbi:TPA: DUF551 domain-containing protein [Klebsiella michiganensis]|nr:DUF551 domain-containing protein [Klebsiella michiganensis]